MHYNMQDEAPPQYANISKILDRFQAEGIKDPYVILIKEPSLNSSLAGAYSRAIIERHPVEFLVKSVPVFFSSLTVFYEEAQITPHGHFARYLTWVDAVFQKLYLLNICFPFFAEIWLVLLCWRGTRQLRTVQLMGGVVLLALYGLVSMTLGAYRDYDYPRIHSLFEPLVILIMWSTFLKGVALLVQHRPGMRAWLPERSFLRRKAV
jgi:Txe/YoeB family toxin of Txe-Axe toxin-antitoxin module